MAAPQPDIRACFDAQLKNLLPQLNLQASQIAWFNAKFTADCKKLYIKPSLLLSPTQQASLGASGFERISGIYQVSVFALRDVGSASFEAVARGLVDYFRAGTKLVHSGLEITVQTSYSGTPLEQEDRVLLPVSIVWFCYVQKG